MKLKYGLYYYYCSCNWCYIYEYSAEGYYIYIYLLTPCRTVLIEKLTCSQLVKKFPTFYGTQRFITTFTSSCHLSLSWASSIQSMTFHFLKIQINIFLPSTPGSPKWFLSLRFPHQNPVCAPPLLHTSYMPHPSHFLDFITPTILGEQYRSLSSLLCSHLLSLVTSSILGQKLRVCVCVCLCVHICLLPSYRLIADGKLYYRFITSYCTQTHCVSKTSNHLKVFRFMPVHWDSKRHVHAFPSCQYLDPATYVLHTTCVVHSLS